MSGQAQSGHQPDEANASSGPVVYIITVELKPGRAAEFFALVEPVLDAMRHEESFIDAVLHRDPETPDRFMLYETWADHDEVMRVQIHRAYRQAYWTGLPALLARPREVRIWRPLRRLAKGRPLPADELLTAAG